MIFEPSLLARRAGRVAFGTVLVLGMLVLAGFALHYQFREMPIHAWQILLGTWLAAFGLAGVVRTLTDFVTPPEPATGEEDQRLRVAAFVMPAIGIALIAPLTLHAIFALLINLCWPGVPLDLVRQLDRFDGWAVASLALTGPAHVTFAALVGRRAKQLVCDQISTSVRTIYVACTVAACVPGIVVILPPVVVALTGLPLLPLLYWMPRVAARDREPRIELPTAVARVVP